jgi:hypothetical protein
MARNVFAVYSPPTTTFPYLAVMLFPDGRVEVEPFDTFLEAIVHNRDIELQLYGGPIA